MSPDFEALGYQAGMVFTPAAPVDKKALFAGRLIELSRVIDSINTKGQHAILYGERGVGKTSLANIIRETLELSRMKGIMVNRINCDSKDDFTSVWRKALREIVYIAESTAIGFEQTTHQYVFDFAQGIEKEIGPDKISQTFRNIKSPLVFIFDEFDRMKDPNIPLLFSDTMKSLSDNLMDATLILVGVADDVNDLIRGHESIVRSLNQIRLPRMNAKELREIIDKGLEKLNASITEDAANRILRHSQGLPHYTHLLSRDAARSAFYRQSHGISVDDVKQAVLLAVDNAQQTVSNAYQIAVSSTYPRHLYKEVLLACALTKGDDYGFFTAANVREPLGQILQKKVEITAFGKHLNKFSLVDRGQVLIKSGTKRNFRYRFKDPLLPPYIIFRGFVDRQLTDDMIDLIPIWSQQH